MSFKTDLEDIVWKLMVGCATANIGPEGKQEYMNKISQLALQAAERAVGEDEEIDPMQNVFINKQTHLINEEKKRIREALLKVFGGEKNA